MIAASKSERMSIDISAERVRKIFEGLKRGDGAAFFQHAAEDVDWTVSVRAIYLLNELTSC